MENAASEIIMPIGITTVTISALGLYYYMVRVNKRWIVKGKTGFE